MKIPQEFVDEYKALMLFCRHNQEAKDRLSKIYALVEKYNKGEK